MKRTAKMLSILLVAIMLVAIVTPVFATGTRISPSDIESAVSYSDTGELKTMAGRVVGLIRNIAVIAGVILLSVIGVKFMMGSAEEKAEYKKSLVPLVIGIVVVMAATQIMTMVVNFIGTK